MPMQNQIERAAKLDREIEELVARIFEAQREGRNTSALQQTLDRRARALTIIKSALSGHYLELENVA